LTKFTVPVEFTGTDFQKKGFWLINKDENKFCHNAKN
jgi:hypothetical protein